MTWWIARFDSLKSELTHFLEENGIKSFFGVEGPYRGSKICSFFIKKEEDHLIKDLHGKNNGFHEFWFSKSWEHNTSIKYLVNCKKI